MESTGRDDNLVLRIEVGKRQILNLALEHGGDGKLLSNSCGNTIRPDAAIGLSAGENLGSEGAELEDESIGVGLVGGIEPIADAGTSIVGVLRERDNSTALGEIVVVGAPVRSVDGGDGGFNTG